jgi:hypothetical protein
VERGWTIHFESGKMWGTFTRIRFMGKSREHRPRLGVWSFSRILFSSKESTKTLLEGSHQICNDIGREV